MANVLMGWELGGGLGHIAQLLPIARRLRDVGHRPFFVVRNPKAAETLFSQDEFSIRAIPPLKYLHSGDFARNFQAGSYADILHVHSFGVHDELKQGLDAWDRIFEEIRPELIVLSHAPRLNLAALGRIEVIHIGTGYTCPPLDGETFPSIPADGMPVADQPTLLQVIQEVQRRRRAIVPERLTDVLACRNEFVTVWRQLDPYQAIRKLPAIGPLEPTPLPSGRPARHAEFFAYLSGEVPGVEQVIAALVRSGISGKAYLRDATAEQQQFLQAAGVTVEPHPVPLDAVMSQIPLVVHHGGAGVAAHCLSAGCCQIILPRHQEQMLTGDCVETLKTGRSFFGNVRLSGVIEAAHALLDSDHRERALQVAETLSKERPYPAIELVFDKCVAYLKKPGR